MNETNITTTPTFKTCGQAWTTLFVEPHKANMAQRKDLRAQIAALTQQLKGLRVQDKANFEAFRKVQADFKAARAAKKAAKVAPQA